MLSKISNCMNKEGVKSEENETLRRLNSSIVFKGRIGLLLSKRLQSHGFAALLESPLLILAFDSLSV